MKAIKDVTDVSPRRRRNGCGLYTTGSLKEGSMTAEGWNNGMNRGSHC
jgi:hypothetical protein